jgi:hypothetical protein
VTLVLWAVQVTKGYRSWRRMQARTHRALLVNEVRREFATAQAHGENEPHEFASATEPDDLPLNTRRVKAG